MPNTVKPLSHKRLFQGVVEKMTALIETGAFPLGSRLPGERELAERFGVSRVTVREAAVVLQALGLVTIRTGSGAYVCKVPPAAQFSVPVVSAFELTEARALFEAEAAALAAARIDGVTLARLGVLVEALVGEVATAEHEAADREFHLTVAAASGNAAISYAVAELWRLRCALPEVSRAYAEICRMGARSRFDEHRAIYVALCARDAGAARTAMRVHFQRILQKMLDASEERALREARQLAAQSRKRFSVSTNLP